MQLIRCIICCVWLYWLLTAADTALNILLSGNQLHSTAQTSKSIGDILYSSTDGFKTLSFWEPGKSRHLYSASVPTQWEMRVRQKISERESRSWSQRVSSLFLQSLQTILSLLNEVNLKENHLVEYTEVLIINGFSFEDMISSITFNDKPSA